MPSNNVQTFREDLMMSKAELARKAGLSTLTIDRVEAGRPCRLDTKRKILLALGLKVTDKDRVFGLAGEPRRRVSMASAPHASHELADVRGEPARVGLEAEGGAGKSEPHGPWRGGR